MRKLSITLKKKLKHPTFHKKDDNILNTTSDFVLKMYLNLLFF